MCQLFKEILCSWNIAALLHSSCCSKASVSLWSIDNELTCITRAAGAVTSATADHTNTKTAKKAQDGAMTPREVALTRTLMATSVLFVLCLTPTLLVQLASFVWKELRQKGRHHNLFSALWSFVFLCKAINSSLNFFVYYAMGSRFRDMVRQLLACCTHRKKSAAAASASDSVSAVYTAESTGWQSLAADVGGKRTLLCWCLGSCVLRLRR